ncbi:TIGR01777 family protein [Paenibacillus psychroresistens]|uniref:TIGR01777 family protein n=1 Tax=Paenibacillus psychroresistens TaxID=1778678 RepID=A0A6B8RKN0_9BACL|nr:TIGR01777 family oxidoreductase [Paenibacillus psychroresistens]QGQ96314.1 TIGR01777 family protein [Paenibacillus psychroresistens]
MKIAISGGSGFIGTHLINYLLTKQYEVLLISRSPKITQEKVVCVTWAELDQDSSRIEKLDAWINLAGESINQRWTKSAKSRIIESRITIIHHIAKLMEKLEVKPRVIIHSSAIGIYGTSDTKTFTEESKSKSTDFLSEVVREWEKAAEQLKGARVVRLRTGLVLSLDGGALPTMVMPYRFGIGGRVGKGTQWVSWIHITDMVRLFDYCLTSDHISGAVNAVSPHPVTMEQFGKTIARVWHRPHLFPVPSFVLKLMFGEMSVLVLEGQRVLPQVLLEHDYVFQFKELEPALQELHKE